MAQQQVTITLTALTGDVSIAQRKIILSPELVSIPIGRASKSVNKGILGAPANAWFDSPVMSRNHAEVILEAENSSVIVLDIGSMHGTYLNDRKLQDGERSVVLDGDKLIFGAEVRRGTETFPACAFQVNLEFTPYRPTNAYSVPDSSEIGEGESDFSSADYDQHEQSSEDDISIQSRPSFKVIQSVDAIDLTRDTPIPTEPTSIDLTGDGPIIINHTIEPTIVNEDEDDENEIIMADDRVVVSTGKARNQSIFLDSEDDGNLSSDSEGRLEIAGPDSDADDDSEDMDMDMDDLESNEDSTSTSFLQNNDEDHEDVTENSEDFIEEFESELGLSDAGDEGLRSLFDGSAQNEVFQPFGSVDSVVVGPAAESPPKCRVESSGVPHGNATIINPIFHTFEEDLPERGASVPETRSVTFDTPPVHPLTGIKLPSPRLPSPSDAAMVKTAPSKQAEPDSPFFLAYSRDFGQLSQTLGDKTGKHAYFEAREKNKVEVGKIDQEGNTSIIFPHASASSGSATEAPPMIYRRAGGFGGRKPIQAQTSVSTTNSLNFGGFAKSNTPSSTLLFRNFTAPEPPTFAAPIPKQLDREPSPEYDMESAVKYNQSKAKLVRSKLSIKDICITENTSQDQDQLSESNTTAGPKPGEKRKAGDMSDNIHSEVQSWAANQNVLLATDGVAIESCRDMPNQQTTAFTITGVSSLEERPAKRMKRTSTLKTILDRAAYAAAGAVVAGAGVFLTLVVTAPDFS